MTTPEPVTRVVEEFDKRFPYIDGNNAFGELDHVKDFITTHATKLYNDAVREERERIEAKAAYRMNQLILKIERVAPAYALELTQLAVDMFDTTPTQPNNNEV